MGAGQTHPASASDNNDFEHLQTCIDEDECAAETHGCGAGMTCTNVACDTDGQACYYDTPNNKPYTCMCADGVTTPTGTMATGLVCPDVDECTEGAGGSSVYFGTSPCQKCKATGDPSSDVCSGADTFDAGMICINKDVNVDNETFQC